MDKSTPMTTPGSSLSVFKFCNPLGVAKWPRSGEGVSVDAPLPTASSFSAMRFSRINPRVGHQIMTAGRRVF